MHDEQRKEKKFMDAIPIARTSYSPEHAET